MLKEDLLVSWAKFRQNGSKIKGNKFSNIYYKLNIVRQCKNGQLKDNIPTRFLYIEILKFVITHKVVYRY